MERVHPTICHIGYGQRGLRYSNQITWERNCYETDYCYEAVTDDIEKVRRLIDFPWDPYYYQFFVKSCGGDHGMPAKDYHPWQDLAEFGAVEGLLGSLTVNLTFPMTITGHGGVENFDLRYTCRKDLCSGIDSCGIIRHAEMPVCSVVLWGSVV